jgi:UDP-glucose:(heptosyl)LPS alpha-1,3-glucosyltransferase
MRLAFIKKKFFLHGGAERYMQTLLGELREEGHDIHIYADSWAEAPGFTFHHVDINSAISFLSVYSFSKNAAAALKREKYDCVTSFERTEYQDIFRAGDGCHRAWLAIRSAHEPAYRRLSFRLNPLHRYTLALEKRIFTETPLIVVNSEMVRAQITGYYNILGEKIVVAYNGVDLELFSPANREKWRGQVRASLGIDESDKVILFAGTGFKRKGIETLIKALPSVMSSGNGNIITLVLGRDDSSRYMDIARKSGLGGKIIFLGVLPDIERFYAAADVFVLPTLYDPFSNACLEAMASGLPVVTTRNNGVSEIIGNGMEGFIAESAADPAELAEKIIRVLPESAVMGARARLKAEKFSIETASENFLGLIKKVALEKKPS